MRFGFLDPFVLRENFFLFDGVVLAVLVLVIVVECL